MKKKLALSLASLITFTFSTQISIAESNGISLTLNGKEIKSVPVDKLGEINFKVTSGKTFKQFYSAQWGKLDNALIVVTKIFKKGSPTPDLSEGKSNYVTELGNTYSDSGWGNNKTAVKPMLNIAKNNSLFNANTSNNIAIGVRFSRREYTGKTIWKNGGWVQETRWVDIGPVLATTVLSLEEPSFAKTLDLSKMMEDASNSLNNNEQKPLTSDNASAFARDIFNGSSTEASDYQGSKSISLEKKENPVFNWNYEDDAQLVYVTIPAKLNIHAVKKNGFMGSSEADFICNSVRVSSKRYLSKNSFENVSVEIGADFSSFCLTKDGKKGKDFGNTSSTGSAPSAMDLINGVLKEIK